MPAWVVALLALFGCGNWSLLGQEQALIEVGEEWRYFKGSTEPPADWSELGFDDASWLAGPTGIGYSDNDDATTLPDMQNGYASIFCRRVFNAANAASVTVMRLSINYDDGFVAYLNGVEVARSASMAAAGTPPLATTLATDHEAGAFEDFDIPTDSLENGANVLAVQVHNTTLASSDLSFIPRLIANPSNCPQGFTCVFDSVAGSVTLNWTNRAPNDSIRLERDGRVLEPSLDGTLQTYTDFLPPGGDVTYSLVGFQAGAPCPALDCTVFVFSAQDIVIDAGDIWIFFRGTTEPPPEWNQETFDDSKWEIGATGIGYGDNDDATVLDDMQQIAGVQNGYLAIFTRKPFRIDDLAETQELILNVTYDDGYAAYINGVEVGRVNLPAPPAAVTSTTAALAAIANGDRSEIRIPRSFLKQGDNLLAVSVHNTTLTSSDLTFLPILVRVGGAGGELRFRRGDLTNDAVINLGDCLSLLNYLFQNGSTPACIDTGDVNDDAQLNLTDAFFLLNSLFLQGPAPPAPGLACGLDPTADGFGNCSTTGC